VGTANCDRANESSNYPPRTGQQIAITSNSIARMSNYPPRWGQQTAIVRKFDQECVQKFDRKCDRFEQKTVCKFVLEFDQHELYNASSEFDRHELKIGARFGHGTNQVRRRHIELVKRDSERFASHCRFHVELGRNDSHADSHVVRSNVF